MADKDNSELRTQLADVPDFKLLRREFDLTATQIADALDVSTATIEAWERGLNSPPDIETVTGKIGAFVISNPSKQHGKNLLFGHYPLRLGRELLFLTVDEMAAQFGYSKSSWTKIEANIRALPTEKLRQIEAFVRKKLAEIAGI